MPRKLKLHYKKYATKTQAKDAGATDVATVTADDDNDSNEKTFSSGKLAHSSTQTEESVPASFESCSTQTKVVTTCDVSMQTSMDPDLLLDEEHLLTPMKFTFVVSLKLDLFYSLKLTNIDQLHRKLAHMKCINNWFLIPGKLQSDRLQMAKLGQPQAMFTVEILNEMNWSIQLPNGWLSHENSPVLKNLPRKITTLNDLIAILNFLDQCMVCKGNSDSKFAPIVAQHKGIFMDKTGKLFSSIKLTFIFFVGTRINVYFDQQ